MKGQGRFVAVDLGASNGRVVSGTVKSGLLHLSEHARFPNGGVAVRGRLYWDVLALWQGMLTGIRAASREGPVDSVGIDSWGADYGLVDESGELLGLPVHYRDPGHVVGLRQLVSLIDPADLYRRNGTALLPFVTAAQLLGEAAGRLQAAHRLLLLPDLFGYWLTGVVGAEATDASTTGLLKADGTAWDVDLIDRLGIPGGLFAPLRRPGDQGGLVDPRLQDELGLGHRAILRVVASHDTASAVVAVPVEDTAFAFLSAGTWSLVGVEVERPVLDERARKAGFTNEQGMDGTVRFLRNVMGLWLLQESLRTWELQGLSVTLASLLEAAANLPAAHWLFEPDSGSLMESGDMPARIQAACRSCDQPVPTSPAEVVRSVVDSLALAHRRAIRQAAELSDRKVEVVYLVGGGARNRLLCQATADASGLPLVSGPIEATAIGNLLVQARGQGLLGADLGSLRACVRRSFAFERYEPRDIACWDRADKSVESPRDQVHESARSKPKTRRMPGRPFIGRDDEEEQRGASQKPRATLRRKEEGLPSRDHSVVEDGELS